MNGLRGRGFLLTQSLSWKKSLLSILAASGSAFWWRKWWHVFLKEHLACIFEFVGNLQNHKHAVFRGAGRLQVPLEPDGSGWWQDSAVVSTDLPSLLAFCLSPDELESSWLDFSAWFPFPFCRGTVCGFCILSVHRRFVTDPRGAPASPAAGLKEPEAARWSWHRGVCAVIWASLTSKAL